ncbi:inositol monophosphatase family protein [Pelagicoccus sp. SDUM812003]|uniref:3'(2'),5'-bisphosphate nucleotidase CysQ family protein n=1 Tax=Pelagicoccus sp. SDUM812003 TaxID=3041267 RepID=UPI0028106A62|nr:inositol monophosphatase family protein [Pelagicoccus sp. SDUM812003]MDQ8203118.1 inositol monophosphatase family protein [Pelagicoccus sp. SDUM812003]
MNLSEKHLYAFDDYAVEAAKKAAKIIVEKRSNELQVLSKEGGDTLASQVVTEVDRLAQSAILDTLRPCLKELDLGLLAEESSDDGSRFSKDAFLCIDPLDGTLPYIKGTGGFAVSIAIVRRDGTPLYGLVLEPLTGKRYQAISGMGIRRDAKPWNPPTASGSSFHFYGDCSFIDQPDSTRILDTVANELSQLGYTSFEKDFQSGGVMSACHVMENAPACYFKFPKEQPGGGSPWDFAATACLFHEANRVATDIHGDPLDLNRRDSIFMNHRGILFATDENIAHCIQNAYAKLRP